jgi:tetratricopeptide (TPR) repeat protein
MKWALDAIGKDTKNAIARYVLAELALRREDFDEAKHWYGALVADGIDSFDIRGRLALIAKQQGNLPEAARQLCAAKRLDPERSYPYQELYEIYKQMGDQDKALAELETYVTIEQMQYAPVKQLVDEYAAKGSWRKVRTYGELALFINPSDADLFLKLGRAYLESGDPDKALFTYDSALLAKPEIRRPALAHIGRARAYELLKQPKKARAAIDQALKTEAENAEALALKKRLPK